VTAVEIREIKPPVEIEQAMTRQMSAERERRATVTRAMGEREATIRIAEGERQAAILRAEGAAQALLNVFEAARQIDSKTMALQYLDMLRTVGAGESTKLVVPAELMGLLRPFLEHHAAAAEAR
jgi:regulator of protease activity HflC (stomatin/prohibitin superfamily)